MTVDLNELISFCEQALGLNLEAIAQRLGVDLLELDLAAASRSGLSAEYDAAVSALTSQARAAAERAAAREKPHRYRGRSDDELIDACHQISDSADAASLIEAAIEAGVDGIVEAKIITKLAKACDVDRATLKNLWKKQAAAHKAALAPTDEERAEAAAKQAEKAVADREAEKASLMSRIEWLARSPDILTQAVQFLWDEGVAGERSALIALNLLMAGRMHKTMPMALLRTGAPASGKSFVVEKALSMLPPSAVVRISGSSPKSLVYMQEPLAHRIVSISEAAALLDSSGHEKEFATMLRIMISEARLDYFTVAIQEERDTLTGKAVRRPVTHHLQQAGPITVVMTSARDNVEPELHTRVVLSPADESAEQTVRAARKAAARTGGQPLARKSRTTTDDWVAFHRFLELSGPFDVAIPFLDAFVACLRPGPLRQRRDNRAVVAATSASAILHSAQRLRDAQGQVVAEIADYQNAFEALNGGLATAYAPIASPGVISIVKTLEEMLTEQKAAVDTKLLEWRKNNPHAASDPPPPDLLPVTTVRATYSQLTTRLGPAKDLIGQRLRAALDAGAIVRANPGAPRGAGGEYQIVKPSATLVAGQATALPVPADVASMQADQARLAKIIERIDTEIAANEQATPSPGLQPATAITADGLDTGVSRTCF